MADSTLAFNILTRYRDTGARAAASDMDRLGNTGSRMGTTLKKVAAAGALALGAGVVIAAKSLVGMTKNAMADMAAQRKLAVGLKNATGATRDQISAVEDWITKQGVALGVTDDELRPAFQRLVQATGDVGQAQKLAGIAMDASAGSGKSLKTVTEAIAKAQNGNLGSLSRLGVAIKDADGKTLSFKQAMKGMADTFKGQASAQADTFEGKMKRLNLVWDEAKESIGSKLIPVLTKFADWFLNKGLPAISEFGDWFKENLLPTLQSVGDFIVNQIVPRFVALAKWIGKNGDVVIPLVAALGTAVVIFKTVAAVTKLWAAAQVMLNIALTANPIGIVIVAIAALVVGLVVAYKRSETFRKIVDTAFRVVAAAGKWMWNNVLKPAFTAMKAGLEAVGKAGVWLWNNALQPAFKFIIKGVAMVLDIWAKMLRVLGNVPGFGWAKKAADVMAGAADKARDLADNIKKIPDHKNVSVHVAYSYSGLKDPTRGHGDRTLPPPGSPRALPGGASGRTMTSGGGGGGDTYVVNVYGALDPNAVARQIKDLLTEFKRKQRQPLGLA